MNAYLYFLARKFLGKRNQESFIWFTSLVSVVGIALGVASLMIVLGVMNGFSNDLKRKIIGANPHIVVEGDPYLQDYARIGESLVKNVPGITEISAFAQTQVIFKSTRYLVGGFVKGIEAQKEAGETGRFMKQGALTSVGKPENGLVLGSELAKELGVGVGDTVQLVGGLPPEEFPFTVTGIIEYGVYNIDVSLGLIGLESFQKSFFSGRNIANLGIKVNDIYVSEKIAAKIAKIAPAGCKVSTWIKKNKILFAALALEKKAMLLILAVIILIASFNIAGSLMMTVFRKIREIGVLRTLGLTSWEIRKIFVLQGLILGIRGLAAGLLVGSLLITILKKYKVIRLPEYIYNLSYLPLEISAREILLISAAVLVMTLAASLFPAYRAGKLEPATAIRYE